MENHPEHPTFRAKCDKGRTKRVPKPRNPRRSGHILRHQNEPKPQTLGIEANERHSTIVNTRENHGKP